MMINSAKYLLLVVFVLVFGFSKAQILTFDHGEIEFYTSSVLSDIEAVSDEVSVNFNPETGEIDVSIDIMSFKFEYDLMKNHFNQKHMETDKFPVATFKGKVKQDLSAGIENETEVDASGDLTIHGVTNKVSIKANISKEGEFTVVKSKFIIVFEDYNVDEPSILTKSVAKDVEVKSTLYLK